MSTGAALFTAIVDDAALFPPGNATMPDALAAHPHHKAARYADVVGRFLCPASRVDELIEVLPEEHQLALGIIADTGVAGLTGALDRVHGDHRLDVEAVEVTVDRDRRLSAAVTDALSDLPPLLAFIEIPRQRDWLDALDAVAAAGRGAKLRTGGGTAAMFPDEHEVASFISACAERDVPFKCTAGLHNAVRHRDSGTGFEHHGFLNVALATHAAVLGEGIEHVTALLGESDGEQLVSAYRQITDHAARRTRASFVGFGTCSILEPVHDLTALGLL